MQLTLDKGKIGTQYYIRSVHNDIVESKLMAMGLRAGASVNILRRTLLGGAVCIKSEGMVIALRQSEAAVIFVENLPN